MTTISALTPDAAAQIDAAAGLDGLSEFAMHLRNGERCSAVCDQPARWSALAAPDQVLFACDQHLPGMLDRNFIWFLHPMPMGSD